MDDILFINEQDFSNKIYGGSQCTKRNYDAICDYFQRCDSLNLYHEHRTTLYKIYMLLMKKNSNLTNRKYILEKCKGYRFIFIDRSCNGIISYWIKKKFNDCKVITFFHNVEYDFVSGENKNILNMKLSKGKMLYNEYLACKYSDSIISLNFRDTLRIEKLYDRKADAIIPISFPNKCINFNIDAISVQPVAVFLGSDFFANIHGIKWFIEEVLPFVNIRLKIVGKGMDKINLPKNEKSEVFGYVENLDDIMQTADFVVLPIFFGSGMKVKTCEALMHGKNIIGTYEAFQGYDMNFEKVGACCETAEEFVKAINEFPERFTNKFNEYSRNVFLEKYSNDVTFKQFADIFRKLQEQK